MVAFPLAAVGHGQPLLTQFPKGTHNSNGSRKRQKHVLAPTTQLVATSTTREGKNRSITGGSIQTPVEACNPREYTLALLIQSKWRHERRPEKNARIWVDRMNVPTLPRWRRILFSYALAFFQNKSASVSVSSYQCRAWVYREHHQRERRSGLSLV